MSVIVDLLEGERARKTVQGWEFTRNARVTGMAGVGHARLYNAVAGVIASVGDIGASHPTHATALLREFQPRADSSEEVFVGIVYTEATYTIDQTVLEVGSAVSQRETNKDYAGVPVILTYTFPNDHPDPNLQGYPAEHSPILQKLVPESTIVARRREVGSPGANSRLYVGKVNSGGWSLDPGCLARQWFCYSILGRSNDGGVIFTVTYNFHYREDKWDQDAAFIDPYFGVVPSDIVPGVGEKTVQMAAEIDFNGLSLP